MASKTTKAEAPVIVAEEIPRGPIFVALQAALTEAKLLHKRGEEFDKLAEQYTELKQKYDSHQTQEDERGELIEAVTPSGKITYSVDSVALQIVMESLIELLAVMPANEVHENLDGLQLLA